LVAKVFISYARTGEAAMHRVSEALRAAGHDVWTDAELPAHRAYAEVIEERLGAADAVVVLWSAAAEKSQWVRAEAEYARERGRLVQAALDERLPPMPFNQIQCADLKAWKGDRRSAQWRKVLQSLEHLAPQPQASAPPSPAASDAPPAPRIGPGRVAAIAGVLVAIVTAAGWFAFDLRQRNATPADPRTVVLPF
jgi:adenylate cyclase